LLEAQRFYDGFESFILWSKTDFTLLMEYVYAALLLHKLQKPITEENVSSVIKATGASPDEVKVKALVAALTEVNIDEALKAAPIAVAASSAPTSPTSEAAPASSKEEEKKEEKKEEEALEGLSALFG
jgi:large subunit ribosomal protein L12